MDQFTFILNFSLDSLTFFNMVLLRHIKFNVLPNCFTFDLTCAKKLEIQFENLSVYLNTKIKNRDATRFFRVF